MAVVAILLNPKVIFLKSYKTASTSVEAAFASAFLGTELTETTPLSLLRAGIVSPRYKGHARGKKDFWRATAYSLSRPELIRSVLRLQRLRNHSTPDELRNILGKRFWSRSRKVIGVRNPFDLVVSDYFFRYRNAPRPPFSEFVANYRRKGINATVCRELDDSWSVIRFEKLQEDVERVAHELRPGVVLGDLPRYKTEHRPEEYSDYRNLYGPLEVEKISQVYADWIHAFGYKFE
jgi:hypothetical protein